MRRALGGSEKDRFSAATVGSNPGGAGKERCLRPGRNSTRADDSGTVDVIEFAVVIVVRVMGTQSAAQIPTSFGKELRACLRCSLVKTYKQVRFM
ncbi:hypothetical protein Mapa_002840 [Marchantia paleacea]|nr:hypothetical protein Mapa_002840 [Marchantia paleacea]